MNPSWSMVLGALLAGTVGGFMVPVRPEIRDVPALTKVAEPGKSESASAGVGQTAVENRTTPAKASVGQAGQSQGVRKIPLTDANTKGARAEAKAEQDQAPQTAAAASCSTERWPYRTPNCLDRSAAVAKADVTVSTKPVEPKVSVRDTAQPETKSAQKPASPPDEQQASADPDGQQASADTDEQQASADTDAKPEKAKPASAPKRSASRSDGRRSARRSARRTETNFNDGIPTRVYLRGPDGRYYLAPEYRFRAPPRYYAVPPQYMR